MTSLSLGRRDALQELSPGGVRWLIILRMVVVLIAVSAYAVRQSPDAETMSPSGIVYAVLLGVFLLNIVYFALLRWFRRRIAGFVAVQIVVDILAETVIVFLTGGLHSFYVPLYFASIMAASMLLSRSVTVVFASLSTIGLAAATTMLFTGTLVEWVPPQFQPVAEDASGVVWHRLVRMLIIVTAFFLVTYLSGVLRGRLAVAQILTEEILRNMPEGVVVFNARNRAAFYNEEFLRIFWKSGTAPGIGASPEDLIPGEDAAKIRETIVNRDSASFELPEREESPTRPPLEVRTAPVGDGRDPRGVVAIFIDLSWRLRAETAERRAERFEAVGEMAAGLAHEIRNPLASVRGSIQEISSEFADDTPQYRLCRIVMKESDRLDRIIGEFLQFARRRPMHIIDCDVCAMLDEVRALLSSRPDAAGVELDFEYEPGLSVRGDAEQIREVLLNLGVNACLAMEGSGRLSVTAAKAPAPEDKAIDTATAGDGVLISFADTGPGVPAGSEELIFEPFYTTRAGGTGLGLAITQRAVQHHGGAVWVENAPGGGAVFRCWLPGSGPKRGTSRREGTGIFRRRKDTR